MAILFISVVAGSLGLLFVFAILLGLREIAISHTLKKRAESITGKVRDVDLKAAGQAGSYGKVSFEYQVNGVNYRISQTVSKDTALGLLAGSQEIAVLVLPRRPRLARLAREPAQYTRILSLIIALIVLAILAAILLFSGISMQAHSVPP